MSDESLKICLVGGTGAQGSGLALRWANSGHSVVIASRDQAKAQAVANELNRVIGKETIIGRGYETGISEADVIVLTVPFTSQKPIIEAFKDRLAGKILIDVTVPLLPPKVSTVQLPETDSCVVAIQQCLGADVRVVSAFQNVSAQKLKKLQQPIDCDVLVTSDNKDAREIGIKLAKDAGMRGIDAGPLANSVVAEALTSALIWINRKYKVPDAGIRITGLDGVSA